MISLPEEKNPARSSDRGSFANEQKCEQTDGLNPGQCRTFGGEHGCRYPFRHRGCEDEEQPACLHSRRFDGNRRAARGKSSGTFEKDMIHRDRHLGSLRKFIVVDLLIQSYLPFAAIGLLSSWLFGLQGTAWIVAYAGAFFVSVAGAALIFVAKLPLYRKGMYFSIGPSALPEHARVLYHRGVLLSLIGILLSALLIGASYLWR